MANLSLPALCCLSTCTKSIFLHCFAFVLFQCVVAYPVELQGAPSGWDPHITCKVEGNSDIYGLGIRLGLYLQWTASLLSKRFLVSSNLKILRDLLGANVIFCLSIFIATAVLSTGHIGNVYNVEILILHHMFFGGAYMISYDHLRGGAKGARVTFWSSATLVTVATCMAGHTIWFWGEGVHELPNTDCGSFVLLFGKSRLWDSAAYGLYYTAAICNMMVWGMGFFFMFLAVFLPLVFSLLTVPGFAISAALDRLRNRYKGNVSEAGIKWRDRNQGHGRYVLASIIGILGTPEAERAEKEGFFDDTSPAKGNRNGSSPANPKPKSKNNFWSLVGLAILVYSIVIIELTIKWNSLSHVYTIDSTGQVIPLVIGASILIKTLFAIAAYRLNESPFCPDKESFRLKYQRKWVSFPIHKPERRHSWTGDDSDRLEWQHSGTGEEDKAEQQQEQQHSSTGKEDEKGSC